MDKTKKPKQIGGSSKLSGLRLLLVLAGLQPLLSAGETPELHSNGDRLEVLLLGPDYVTVGVPASVVCLGTCSNCTYVMSLDGEAALGQGNVLDFTVTAWAEDVAATCTATDDDTGANATATKRFQVLVGPTNVSIAGSNETNASTSYTYTCHAYCRPSCSYAWRADHGAWVGGDGNVVSVTPKETTGRMALTCKATNSVSGMFASATEQVAVASGPSEVQIRGPDSIDIAENYRFTCTAECVPSCRYALSADAQAVGGGAIEVRVDHPLKSVSLRCEARNAASGKTAAALKMIRVKGLDSNPSTRPEGTPAVLLLLLAFVAAAPPLL